MPQSLPFSRITTKKILYLIPASGIERGGMTAITKMFYEVGVFENKNIRHFNTLFRWGKSNFVRLFESLFRKIEFIFILITFRPYTIFVMSSSYWGFYDKCFYCLIARFFGVKTMLNQVGDFTNFYESNPLNRKLIRMALKIPNAFLIGSSYWNDYFKKAFPNLNLFSVVNPINCENYQKKPLPSSAQIKVLTISSMIKEKGVEELAGVIKEVCSVKANFLFVIIGGGDKLEWIKNELINEINSGMVEIKGSVSDEEKIEELTTANLFLFLTYFEVIPISILEAMSASLPIISTNIGGIPDIVKDGVNGYLFAKMTIKPVVDKLTELSDKKELLIKMGGKSRAIVLNGYDIHSVLKRHISIANNL
jgi:glycosyltransferase involved in cell wall biosynthesis